MTFLNGGGRKGVSMCQLIGSSVSRESMALDTGGGGVSALGEGCRFHHVLLASQEQLAGYCVKQDELNSDPARKFLR